jgi:hypothetical protein
VDDGHVPAAFMPAVADVTVLFTHRFGKEEQPAVEQLLASTKVTNVTDVRRSCKHVKARRRSIISQKILRLARWLLTATKRDKFLTCLDVIRKGITNNRFD